MRARAAAIRSGVDPLKDFYVRNRWLVTDRALAVTAELAALGSTAACLVAFFLVHPQTWTEPSLVVHSTVCSGHTPILFWCALLVCSCS